MNYHKINEMLKRKKKQPDNLELELRKDVGQRMSNVLYNYSQDTKINEYDRRLMSELYKEWDKINNRINGG